jgi:hypothetical protein
MTTEENKGDWKKSEVDHHVFCLAFNRWNEGGDLLVLFSTGAGG